MLVGYDIETGGKGKAALNPWDPDGYLIAGALVTEDGRSWCWRWDQGEEPPPEASRLLGAPETVLVGHNLKFDVVWTISRRAQPVTLDSWWDTAVAGALLAESEPASLEAVAQRWLGRGKTGSGKNVLEYDDARLREYVTADARLALDLVGPLQTALQEQGLDGLAHWMFRLLPALARMEVRGVKVDRGWARQAYLARSAERDHALQELHQLVGGDFNPGSHPQVAKLLYETLGWEPSRLTPKGQPATHEQAIRELLARAQDPEAQRPLRHLLTYRGAAKDISAFLKPLVKGKLVSPDGRVHTRFNVGRTDLGGTVSGRLSSAQPNLQQIPRQGQVKACFVPTRGAHFAEADYSQLELRVAGWLSADPGFLGTFAEGKDLHTATAAQLSGASYQEFLGRLEAGDREAKEVRSRAKTINFGVLYGAGPNTIADQLTLQGIRTTVHGAKQLIRRWRDAYPVFNGWEAAVHQWVAQHGWVRSEVGRLRRFSYQERGTARAARQASNFLIQSLASDICNLAVVLLSGAGEPVYPVLAVHDSLLVEYSEILSPDYVVAVLHSVMVDQVKDVLHHDFGASGLGDLFLDVDVAPKMTSWGSRE